VPAWMLDNIGSHSLKATLLMACGKYPLPVEDRQLLGYHGLRRESSVLKYHRDNLAGPIEKLWTVLKSIRAGRFLPVAVRSERHRKARDASPITAQFLQDLGVSPEDVVGTLSGFALDESGLIADVVTPAVATVYFDNRVGHVVLDPLYSPTSLAENEEVEEGLDAGDHDGSSSDPSEEREPLICLEPILDELDDAMLQLRRLGMFARALLLPAVVTNTRELLGDALRWADIGLAEWAAVARQLCDEGFGTLHMLAFLSAAL
jgi:hypothetical protein